MGRHNRLRTAVVVSAVLALAGNAWAACYYYEVEPGGHKDARITYVQSGLSHTSAHSVAPSSGAPCGVSMTAGIGGQYCTTTTGTGTWTFTPIETGEYAVYVTWGGSTNGDSDVIYTLNYEGGSFPQHFNMNQNNGDTGYNKWNQVGGAGIRYLMNAGTAYTVVATNPTHEGTAGTSSRLMCDAVLFEKPGCGDVPTVTVRPPVIAGDTLVKVDNVSGTAVKVYANGTPPPIGQNLAPVPPTVDVTVPGLTGGVHINATQVVGGNEGCILGDGPIVGDRAQIPAVTIAGSYIPPGNTVLCTTLLTGDTKIRVSGVRNDAVAVTVYSSVRGSIGSNASPGGATAVDVTVTALVAAETISATQTLPSFSQVGVSLEGAVPGTGPVVDDPAQVATPSIAGLTDAGRTSVRVSGVSGCATAVQVYDETAAAAIGTNSSPTAGTTVVTTAALTEGHVIKAMQTVRLPSAWSATRRVMAAGIIEDFQDTPAIVGDPPIGDGSYRTWYNVYSAGYCVTVPTVSTLFGNQCLRIADNGWTNGEYAIYEQIIPADGDYHLTMDMLVDEAGVTGADLAWLSQYQVGVIVNGTHRSPAGYIAACTIKGVYPGALTDQQDGTTETAPYTVYSDTISAHAGDSLLIAFSTEVTSGLFNKNGTVTGMPQPAMKIDNIKLNVGPRQCLPQDVPAVTITKGPLESGGTGVIVSGISQSPAATLVTVYEYTPPSTWVQLGSANPAGAAEITVPLDSGKKLTPGKIIVATQTLTPSVPACSGQTMEGAKPFVGPVVGTGKGGPIMVTLGIREGTALAGPIGADAGNYTGTPANGNGAIEWVGAASAVSGAPQGKLITPSPYWQTVTFSSSRSGGTDPVLSFNAGNGVLDGNYGVFEHLAFTTTGQNTGRYVIYIDNIVNGSTTVGNFDTADLAGRLPTAGALAFFRTPNTSGTTTGNLLNPPAVATVDASRGDGPGQSLRLEFQFKDNALNRWVRVSSDGTGIAAPGMTYENPQISLTQPVTVRLLLYGCNSPWADLDGDGDVDMDDFGLFQLCYSGTTGTTPTDPPECFCADYDGSTHVDGDDFNMFEKCSAGQGEGILFDMNNPPAGCTP